MAATASAFGRPCAAASASVRLWTVRPRPARRRRPGAGARCRWRSSPSAVAASRKKPGPEPNSMSVPRGAPGARPARAITSRRSFWTSCAQPLIGARVGEIGRLGVAVIGLGVFGFERRRIGQRHGVAEAAGPTGDDVHAVGAAMNRAVMARQAASRSRAWSSGSAALIPHLFSHCAPAALRIR